MPVTIFSADTVIKSSEVNANFALCLLSDQNNSMTGYLGLGRAVSDATIKLDVYSAYNGGSFGQINMESTGTECSLVMYKNSGTAKKYKIGVDTSGNYFIYDETAAANRVFINTTGVVGLGVTPTARNNTSLQILDGVGFPATQVSSTDANTLDDYEEGTWTPSIGGDASQPIQLGRYTKIGRVVYFEFQLKVTTKGTGSATTISGLPFASNSSEPSGGAFINYFGSLAINYAFVAGYIGTNTQSMTFTGTTVAAASMNTNIAIIGDGTEIRGVGHYQV